MALSRLTYAIPEPLPAAGYFVKDPDTNTSLTSIEDQVRELQDLLPQPSDQAPATPRLGMIRYAVTPWLPLAGPTGGWVYYDGSAWVAL
jgi:hypothetical protein